MESLLRRYGLSTVCFSSRCPNRHLCWSRGEATFLLLGPDCTRHCPFCSVPRGEPLPPDPGEPERVARAVRELGLGGVVLTSVTRDDLPDGGAGHIARAVEEVRRLSPGTRVEVLVPDFGGAERALERVLSAWPDAFSHNVETIPRLYPRMRPGADYRRSLRVLEKARERLEPESRVRSALMLGLGEEEEEVRGVLRDLRESGVQDLVLGQYLPPEKGSPPPARYLSPHEFRRWKEEARELGFEFVLSFPLARSSLLAYITWNRKPAGLL